ncbi:MAG: hypothetical protein ACYTBZ_24375 [Planctomycetota bacterium]
MPATIGVGALQGQIGWQEALGQLTAAYTGYNPVAGQWQPGIALANYGAIGLGTAASIVASKVGLNRLLPKGFNI